MNKGQKIYEVWVMGWCDRPSGRREKQGKIGQNPRHTICDRTEKLSLPQAPPSEFELTFRGRLSLVQPLGKNGRNNPVVSVLKQKEKPILEQGMT
jgi:hypothetical protein